MSFAEKYTSISEKDLSESKNKKIISDDAFAIGEMMEALINKIEHTRISLI
jgi:hypothetical protein